VSVGSVGACLARARQAGLSWAEVQPLRDSEVEARLYGTPEAEKRPLPSMWGVLSSPNVPVSVAVFAFDLF
jgi:hypothetical protein